MNKERLITLCLIIAAAAMARLMPHAPNVAPIAALALFSGAQFERRWQAFVIPFFAMLISDAFIGFHSTLWAVYAAFSVTVCIGFLLRAKITLASVAGLTLVASISFFFITNFGVWLTGGIYPLTLAGLSECFAAALPFFRNSLFGDLFYSALLFGGFSLAERKYRCLATA